MWQIDLPWNMLETCVNQCHFTCSLLITQLGYKSPSWGLWKAFSWEISKLETISCWHEGCKDIPLENVNWYSRMSIQWLFAGSGLFRKASKVTQKLFWWLKQEAREKWHLKLLGTWEKLTKSLITSIYNNCIHSTIMITTFINDAKENPRLHKLYSHNTKLNCQITETELFINSFIHKCMMVELEQCDCSRNFIATLGRHFDGVN